MARRCRTSFVKTSQVSLGACLGGLACSLLWLVGALSTLLPAASLISSKTFIKWGVPFSVNLFIFSFFSQFGLPAVFVMDAIGSGAWQGCM